MTDLQTKEFELAAQEMALHISLCVASEYVHSWGLFDYLQKMSEYVEDPDLEDILLGMQDSE